MARPILMAITGTFLALIAACSESESETDANGWRYEVSTTGDFRSSYGASKAETGGPGRLGIGCAPAVDFRPERGRFWEPDQTVPARYRFDQSAPVEMQIWYSGEMFHFGNDMEPDPIHPRLAGARRLTVQVSPPGEEPFTMNFDLTGVEEALRRVRERRSCRPD